MKWVKLKHRLEKAFLAAWNAFMQKKQKSCTYERLNWKLIYYPVICLLLTVERGIADPVQDFLNPELGRSAASFAMEKFPNPLPQSDLEDCLSFLRKHFDHGEENLLIVRQNDLADYLLQQPSSTIVTAHVLLEVIAEKSSDVLWREYCLQKLALAYEQEVTSDELRKDLVSTLRHYASHPAISFSGTSLLGLYRIRHEANITANELIEHSSQILDTPEYATSNKVTALQIAVLLGDDDALKRARLIVADPDADLQLRTSAIASLGQQGVLRDAEIIKPLINSPDYRLRYAARSAVARLLPESKP